MRSTKDVLDHHIKCFFEFDLEGVLSDYARDAVLFTPNGPLKGVDAIRPLFQAMLAEFRKAGHDIHDEAAVGRGRSCLRSVDR